MLSETPDPTLNTREINTKDNYFKREETQSFNPRNKQTKPTDNTNPNVIVTKSNLSPLHSKGQSSGMSLGSLKKVTNNTKILGMFPRKIILSYDEDVLFEKVNWYYSLNNKIKYIDIITNVIDIITVFVFYNDHFDYIDNDFVISSKSNLIRFNFLGTSFLVIVLLIFRYRMKVKWNKIMWELGAKQVISMKQVKNNKDKNFLFLEVLIHILQPYPYLKHEFTMDIVGSDVTYSLNMVWYFLCTLRFYLIIKIIRYWNLYSSPRSKKILRFFDKDSHKDIFVYKCNLDNRGFFTLIIVGVITLLYFSLLLKVLEYHQYDKSNPFNYYWNSIWYLIVTMGTIGYGDITPKTVLGRIIGVLVCWIGVVILSLLVVTLTIFTYLDSDELVAYNSIKSLTKSYEMKNRVHEYLNKCILEKWKFKYKRLDLDCVLQRYKNGLEKVACSIAMHKEKKTKNMHKLFIDNVRDIATKYLTKIWDGFKTLWLFEEELEDYWETNNRWTEICRDSKNLMMSCLNLGNCLASIGSIKNLMKIDEIQHKKVISYKELDYSRSWYTRQIQGCASIIQEKDGENDILEVDEERSYFDANDKNMEETNMNIILSNNSNNDYLFKANNNNSSVKNLFDSKESNRTEKGNKSTNAMINYYFKNNLSKDIKSFYGNDSSWNANNSVFKGKEIEMKSSVSANSAQMEKQMSESANSDININYYVNPNNKADNDFVEGPVNSIYHGSSSISSEHS